MLQHKISGTKASSVIILFIFIIGLLTATAGAYIFSSFYTTEFLDLTVYIVGLLSFVVSLTVADFMSRKLGFNISNDKSMSVKQVNTIWLCLVGIAASLATWIQIGRSPKPSILVPMAVIVAVQIFLYFFASIFVIASSDLTRKKAWTPLVAVLILTVPSVIVYLFAQIG